jgi:curved DNA-binding protein
MDFKDYYKILGVDEKADTATIKAAYRKLARKYHPDVSKEADAERKFKEAGEAWEVLKDDAKRREYDQLRKYGHSGTGGFRPPPGWQGRQGGGTAGGFSDFSDFFEAFFGGGAGHAGAARQSRAQRGSDLRHELTIQLEEAFSGGQRTLNLSTSHSGSRAINVKIPAGITDGKTMRLRGQGNPGLAGGESGDLLLTVRIQDHPRYRLDGRDVTAELPVYPWQAALGDQVRVPTLGGEVKLRLPAGTQSGRIMRLPGRGLPGEPPGDQKVEVSLVLPEPLTEKQKDLLRALADTMDEAPEV